MQFTGIAVALVDVPDAMTPPLGMTLGGGVVVGGQRHVRLPGRTPSATTAAWATIATPVQGTTWAVGDALAFAGSAKSATGVALPPDRLTWQLDLHHCPRDGCHVHPLQTWAGIASGSVRRIVTKCITRWWMPWPPTKPAPGFPGYPISD